MATKHTQVYGDAEKGTLEVHSPQVAATHEKSEKKPIDITVFPVPALKKDAPTTPPAKPAAKPKPKRKVSRWILWVIWYNTYRKFFTFVLSINLIGIGLAASGHFPYAMGYPGAFVIGNLNFSVLMRNEIFGRCLYGFVNTFFAKWTPLWWRLGCTSVLQHLGGIHSGCASSGIAWLILMIVFQWKEFYMFNDSILAFGIITVVVLCITLVAGLPIVRNTHHNVFERNHRFFGWSSLFLSWVYVILTNTYDSSTKTWNTSGVHVVRQQAFWYVVGMTTFIVLPWICTRKVKVDIELPSPKVAVLRFERGMQQGLLARVSRYAVWEYHAFGIISEGTHAKYHYLICGVQGDFTKSLVNDPPRKIWTRELKLAGVSNTSTLYRRGIRICTGTGLGAALSTCIQSPYWYLIWIGSDQEKTFGPTISGLIHRHLGPERYLLWDSKERGGRPDTMKILKEVYDYWQAEVVFITSNFIGNAEIQQGCKAAGIPAFGTLWDF
ncbi:hypothetical protein CONPUDRAFT_98130 [Coniophora puteana RWD-64-598 SS2]|uniref:Non-ribosomal peptide synthetase n=1 Tax=Coniophora puteana (strain RWD-64-598) TaxID=741705 RepID=A0A5M3N1J5_CONPW|nr:uncharacterized protein CONPUDRAFT_98130 [Coniophora puteana RWD-64-598 SS2]EIW85248.1 hypothetical protein CONPUDRAFT_98130 [Coniophora puteana RWD-64-598 SS2]